MEANKLSKKSNINKNIINKTHKPRKQDIRNNKAGFIDQKQYIHLDNINAI